MSKTQIIAEPGTPFVVTTREFDAPRELVFRAHTDPALIVQWLGPRRLAMKLDCLEPRDGGRWRFAHIDTDGSEYWFHGVFHGTPTVDAGITQTFEFEGMPGHVALESVTFEERAGKTVLRNTSVYQSVEDRDGMVESGWAEGVEDSMERLDELFARLVPVS